MKHKEIARVAHEINRAYCQAIGDKSQVPWERAAQWQRDSALLGVKMHADFPAFGPAESHKGWMAHKIKEGWVWGPTKNEKLKTHPCLVPFKNLPVEQQAKDFIFRAIVHALARARK